MKQEQRNRKDMRPCTGKPGEAGDKGQGSPEVDAGIRVMGTYPKSEQAGQWGMQLNTSDRWIRASRQGFPKTLETPSCQEVASQVTAADQNRTDRMSLRKQRSIQGMRKAA